MTSKMKVIHIAVLCDVMVCAGADKLIVAQNAERLIKDKQGGSFCIDDSELGRAIARLDPNQVIPIEVFEVDWFDGVVVIP